MQSVQRGIDGLWHCLRPAFANLTPAAPRQISKPWRRFLSQSGIAPPHHRSTQNTIPQTSFTWDSQPPSVHSSDSQQRQCFRRIKSGPYDLPREPKFHQFKYTPQGYVSPELGNDALYHELLHAGSEGDFIRVYVLVEALVKSRGEKPNSRLYLALILANTNPQHGSPAEVRRLLQEMADEGLAPDAAIHHAVLKVLAIHPDYLLRKDMLEDLRQRWFTLTNDGWHNMIVGMMKDRQLELVLDTVELLQRDGPRVQPWLYDMLVYMLCDAEEFDEALKLMRYRVFNGELLISATLWFYLLDTASRALHHEATLYVWRKRVETSYLNPPSGICINILNTAARHGDFCLATDVFRILGNRTQTLHLYHYESLLESYLAASDLKTALTLLTIMTSSGVPPSDSSTRPVYLYLRQSQHFPSIALSILHDLHKSGRPVLPPAINVVLEAFIYHQDLASAIETYKTFNTFCVESPTTSTFNALLRGCAKDARKDLAMFLASEMLALNVAPNALTYDRLILVCLNAEVEEEQGLIDALRYFEEMRTVGWWPRAGTAVALAKRACERGDPRVWELVGRRPREGMSMPQMEKLASEHWRDPEPEVHREP